MDTLKTNIHYMEGTFQGRIMANNVDKTTYKTLENALITKAEVIRNFEEVFGFSRESQPIDNKYAFTLGVYDALKEIYEAHQKSVDGTSDSNK